MVDRALSRLPPAMSVFAAVRHPRESARPASPLCRSGAYLAMSRMPIDGRPGGKSTRSTGAGTASMATQRRFLSKKL